MLENECKERKLDPKIRVMNTIILSKECGELKKIRLLEND